MPAQRQASFGGVAALFGSNDDDDDDNQAAAAPAPTNRKQQPSFGGVASLFGDRDDDEVGSAAPAAPKARGQQPSFGGVAAMFGQEEEDEKPPTQIITKKPKQGGQRTASFGGVAALFGGDESDEEGPPAGNVANMFGATKQQDTVGALPSKPKPKSQRKGKRDPSVSGVVDLFGDMDSEPKQDTISRSSIHDQLRNQANMLEKRGRKLELNLEQEQIKTRECNDKIKSLQAEMKELKETKLALITSTAVEIDRMRKMLRLLHTSGGTSEEEKAATVG